MPQDDDAQSQTGRATKKPETTRQTARNLFSVPAPVKRIFNKFPLITYPANELPLRAQRSRRQNALYVFTTDGGAAVGSPSFNPSCLKWQVSMRHPHIRPQELTADRTGSVHRRI